MLEQQERRMSNPKI